MPAARLDFWLDARLAATLDTRYACDTQVYQGVGGGYPLLQLRFHASMSALAGRRDGKRPGRQARSARRGACHATPPWPPPSTRGQRRGGRREHWTQR